MASLAEKEVLRREVKEKRKPKWVEGSDRDGHHAGVAAGARPMAIHHQKSITTCSKLLKWQNLRNEFKLLPGRVEQLLCGRVVHTLLHILL